MSDPFSTFCRIRFFKWEALKTSNPTSMSFEFILILHSTLELHHESGLFVLVEMNQYTCPVKDHCQLFYVFSD